MQRGLLLLALAALAAVVAGPAAHTAQAAISCRITNQTIPTLSGTTNVSWTWAVSGTGVTGKYAVYTSATNTATGKSYGTTGTGSPFSKATSASASSANCRRPPDRRSIPSSHAGQLIAQPAYTDGSTLVILTWDEGIGANETVNTVLANPRFAGITLTGPTTTTRRCG
jgi:hypothetical protein